MNATVGEGDRRPRGDAHTKEEGALDAGVGNSRVGAVSRKNLGQGARGRRRCAFLEEFAVKTVLRALTEIRLRRSEEVSHGCEPEGGCDHLWNPDNDNNRQRLLRALEVGNRLHGPATHWIEKRQA